MKMNYQKRIWVCIGLALLVGACRVNARPDRDSLTFQEVNSWGHLGKDAPAGLLQLFKRDNEHILRTWAGDPRRFLTYSYQKSGGEPLYVINPRIECPEWGCPEDSEIYYDNYAPFCYPRKRYCLLTVYTRQNGKYRNVFGGFFGYQGDGEGKILRISEQISDGLPLCFEVKGISLDSENMEKLPPIKEKERYISRYCYNGRDYTLSNIYTERWDWLSRETESERRK
jgi:hypothetical protein